MTNEPRPGFLPIDDYLKLKREPETWLLEPLLPIGGAALMYAPGKIGKSYAAIQLALALSGNAPDWFGFPVVKTGKVLYLQLDTPRGTWAQRFEDLIHRHGMKYNGDILLADRESIEVYPFDILQPAHTNYLYKIVNTHQPVAVIIDTLREANSGDENDSTSSRNVITNLVGATHPAALILINHSRKSNPEIDNDIMDDHRGSNYVVGRMDVIMRFTKNRLYYKGRSIEEGNIKLERLDSGLWSPQPDHTADEALAKVIADPNLTSIRAKGRALSTLIGIGEDTAVSRVRREMIYQKRETVSNNELDREPLVVI